uniref:Uncharacterized protein n=1 Tax=Chromera velia CCMP2878 TaxID=1169474 RepID=A0A0G4FLA0_9ALVE|eukprot:Cvel_17559.t1-p1 / transcript=Cvel_17559.t1 / gene=Cvel_17559 / organism=Chromera_velia_CCMP2878 / gene_product=hypothetical protein / transcript_product=hypothetical protein / location=Cvel_scaffold1410:2421-17101(-) / protein_length=2111 / sequence_SO=supercontig / SO=protein_coding / is_pseudo=false
MTSESTCAYGEFSGEMKCWGQNDYGQLGRGFSGAPLSISATQLIDVGSDLTIVEEISGGLDHFCAAGKYRSFTNDAHPRRAKCWGRGDSAQLTMNATDTSNRGDDTMEMGDNLPFFEIANATDEDSDIASAVCAGDDFSCAVHPGATDSAYGNVWCQTAASQFWVPFVANGSSEAWMAKELGCGHQFACALGAYRVGNSWGRESIRCWGENQFGQLGRTNNATEPVWPGGSQTAVQMAAGLEDVLFPDEDPGTVAEPDKLTVGNFHACGRTSVLKKWYCWGQNDTSGAITCEDKDECASGEHTCDTDTQDCQNIPGAFACVDRETGEVEVSESVKERFKKIKEKAKERIKEDPTILESVEAIADELREAASLFRRAAKRDEFDQEDMEAAAEETLEALRSTSSSDVASLVEEDVRADVGRGTESVRRAAEAQRVAGESLVETLAILRDTSRGQPQSATRAVRDSFFDAARLMVNHLGSLSRASGTGRQAAAAGSVVDVGVASERAAALEVCATPMVSAVNLLAEILESVAEGDEEVMQSDELTIGVRRLARTSAEVETRTEPVVISDSSNGMRIELPPPKDSPALMAALTPQSCADGRDGSSWIRTVSWENGPHDYSVASRNITGKTTTVGFAVCGNEAGEVNLNDQWADILIPVNTSLIGGLPEPPDPRRECRFWNDGEREWSVNGCLTLMHNGSHLLCRCNHFTDFGSFLNEAKTVVASTNYAVLGDFGKAAENLKVDNVLLWITAAVTLLCLGFIIRAAVLDYKSPFLTPKDRISLLVGNDAVVGRLMEGRPLWDLRRGCAVMCKCKGLRKSLRAMQTWRVKHWWQETFMAKGGRSHQAALVAELQEAAEKALRSGMKPSTNEFAVLPDCEILVFGKEAGVVTQPSHAKGVSTSADLTSKSEKRKRSSLLTQTPLKKSISVLGSKRNVQEPQEEASLRLPLSDWRLRDAVATLFIPRPSIPKPTWKETEGVMRLLVRSGAFADYLAAKERNTLRLELQASIRIARWIFARRKRKQQELEQREGGQQQSVGGGSEDDSGKEGGQRGGGSLGGEEGMLHDLVSEIARDELLSHGDAVSSSNEVESSEVPLVVFEGSHGAPPPASEGSESGQSVRERDGDVDDSIRTDQIELSTVSEGLHFGREAFSPTGDRTVSASAYTGRSRHFDHIPVPNHPMHMGRSGEGNFHIQSSPPGAASSEEEDEYSPTRTERSVLQPMPLALSSLSRSMSRKGQKSGEEEGLNYKKEKEERKEGMSEKGEDSRPPSQPNSPQRPSLFLPIHPTTASKKETAQETGAQPSRGSVESGDEREEGFEALVCVSLLPEKFSEQPKRDHVQGGSAGAEGAKEEQEEHCVSSNDREWLLTVGITKQGSIKMCADVWVFMSMRVLRERRTLLLWTHSWIMQLESDTKRDASEMGEIFPKEVGQLLFLSQGGNSALISLTRVQHVAMRYCRLTADEGEKGPGGGKRRRSFLQKAFRQSSSGEKTPGTTRRGDRGIPFELLEQGGDGGGVSVRENMARMGLLLQVFCKIARTRFVISIRSTNDGVPVVGNGKRLTGFADALENRLGGMRIQRALAIRNTWAKRETLARENGKKENTEFALWTTPRALWNSFVRDHPFVYVVKCEDEGLTRVDKALLTSVDVLFSLAILALFFGADGAAATEYKPADFALAEVLNALLGIFTVFLSGSTRVILAVLFSEILAIIPQFTVEKLLYRRPPYVYHLEPLIAELKAGMEVKMSKVESLLKTKIHGKALIDNNRKPTRLCKAFSFFSERNPLFRSSVSTHPKAKNGAQSFRDIFSRTRKCTMMSSNGGAEGGGGEKEKADGQDELWLLPEDFRNDHMRRAFLLVFAGRLLAVILFVGSCYYLLMFSLVYAASPEDIRDFFTSSGFSFVLESLVRPVMSAILVTLIIRAVVRRRSRAAVSVLSRFPELGHFPAETSTATGGGVTQGQGPDTADDKEEEADMGSSVFLVDDRQRSNRTVPEASELGNSEPPKKALESVEELGESGGRLRVSFRHIDQESAGGSGVVENEGRSENSVAEMDADESDIDEGVEVLDVAAAGNMSSQAHLSIGPISRVPLGALYGGAASPRSPSTGRGGGSRSPKGYSPLAR